MSMVSVSKVKKLRKKSGISVMQCKKALEEADGDMNRARAILKEKKLAMAAKKKNREVGEGLVVSYIHNDGKTGVLLDLRSETDFVSGSSKFQKLGREIAMQIAAMNPEDADKLLAQPFIRDEKKTVQDLIDGAVAEFGENIKVERFTRFEI